MCLNLYLATRDALPPRATDSIVVSELGVQYEPVREWFSLPHVQEVGAHTGCSCGFTNVAAEVVIEYYDGMFDECDADERAKDVESVRALLALIAETPGDIELLAAWAGDEFEPPRGVVELPFTTLVAETFVLTQRFLYRVTKS